MGAMGRWMVISALLWLVINLGLLVCLGLWLRDSGAVRHRDDPLAILRIRYQRREISHDEYERRRHLL